MAVEMKAYPAGWLVEEQYHPEQNLMAIRKGTDPNYLNVAQRLVWFIRDQRAMIAAGLAQVPFIVNVEQVTLDREHGFAEFRAFVRDVLGNEATEVGSETAKDFDDYVEKAATKAKGRALAALGYGTMFAPELDEGERIVDTPRQQPQQRTQQPQRQPIQTGQVARLKQLSADLNRKEPDFSKLDAAGAQHLIRSLEADLAAKKPAHEAAAPATDEPPANEQQMASIRKLCAALGREEPDPAMLTFKAASALIRQMSVDYNQKRRAG